MKFTGFTMAEVLITLGIIGIVAAMTMPSLINNNRNKALESSLLKNYSVIQQALNMYQARNGERLTKDSMPYRYFKSTIVGYFNVLHDCGKGAEATEAELEKTCIPNYVNTGNTEKSSKKYKTFNGKTTMALNLIDDGQFVLTDGSLILLEDGSDRSLYISVDVNGHLKQPNKLGHDLFMFEIDEKGNLLPMGAKGSKYYDENDAFCSKTSTNSMNGAGCTNKALTEKDYFSKL